jgi:hypothetical protein
MHHVFVMLVLMVMLFVINNRSAIAARAEYSLGVEATYSDNSLLSDTDINDDLLQSLLFGFQLQEDGARVSADITSMVDYRKYRDNTFNDENWYYLNGRVDVTLRPSSLFWVVEDYYSQVERDTLSPGTPDNLVNTNVFSTGPDIYFRINPLNRLHLENRYTDYRFDDTPTDSQRKSLLLSWEYTVSSGINLSTNAEYHDAQFKELEDSDFRRTDIYFRLDGQQSRTSYQFDLGRSNIDRAVEENVNGYLTHLIVRNQFRLDSYFQFDASAQYTDTAQDLLSANSQTLNPQLNLVGEQISGDVFYDRRVEMIYHLGSSINSYQLQLVYRDEDYEILLQDRRTRGARINHTHNYSSRIIFNSFIQYQTYDNLDVDQLDKLTLAGLAMDYRLSRNYTMRFEYNYNAQKSTVVTSDYKENRILFSVYYGRNPRSYR